MNKVSSISLAKRTFMIEDPAYEILLEYLDKAEKSLAKNPDKDEILFDIEDAIASHIESKSDYGVVDEAKIVAVLEQVGELVVDGDSSNDDSTRAETQQKRVFAVDDDNKALVGVASGIARYYGLSVTLVRIMFIVLAFMTEGFAFVAYIILAILMPDDPKRSAQDIVADSRKKPTKLQSVEKGITSVINAFAMVIKSVVSLALVLLLFGFLLYWTASFINYLSDTGSYSLFGSTVTGAGLLVFASVYVLSFIPFIFTFWSMLGKSVSSKNSVIAASSWGVSLIVALGALFALSPQIEQYLIREQPSNGPISVNVVDGEIKDFCIGSCSDFQPIPEPTVNIINDTFVYFTFSREEAFVAYSSSNLYELRELSVGATTSLDALYEQIQNIQNTNGGPADVIFEESLSDFTPTNTTDSSVIKLLKFEYFVRDVSGS